MTPTGGSRASFYERHRRVRLPRHRDRTSPTAARSEYLPPQHQRRLARAATSTLTAGAVRRSACRSTAAGTFTFVATTGGAPEQRRGQPAPRSPSPSRTRKIVSQPRRSGRIDSLLDPTVTGSIVPARAGVTVHVDVLRKGSSELAKTAVTDAAGRFSVVAGLRPAQPGRRTPFAPPTARTEPRPLGDEQPAAASPGSPCSTRWSPRPPPPRWPRPTAPAARSGRPSCSTITMNFYGRDKKMHRGVLIVRSDLTRGDHSRLQPALDHRFPSPR